MKLTVTEWTNAQDHLDRSIWPQKMLWNLIEHRTFGKQWSQTIAIGLRKEDERIILAALEASKETPNAGTS